MIPQIQPWIDDDELAQLKRVIESTFVVEHDLTREFEALTRELTGSKHAIAVMNGTVGLYCAMKALGIGDGDEVLVPDLTFIATANSIIMAGAKPVFCDIDKNTFCIDVKCAEQLISQKTKAIMPVHLYGQSADMHAVMQLASKFNLKVIEDAAQGVGVKFDNKHTGTYGEIGVLSYYGNKTITCGEGGIILTNDDELAKKCYRLKNHGREKKGVFIHEDIGFNFSFTEMQAAIGIAQMNKLTRIIEQKKKIYETYCRELGFVKQMMPLYYDPRCTPVYWFTSFLTEEVDELSAFLYTNGVQTRRFFYPLHLQPCYLNILDSQQQYPISEQIYKQGISLPSSYHLTEAEQTKVIQLIKSFYESRDQLS